MARVVCTDFLSPSNTATSLAASVSRVINEYDEVVAPGQGKSPAWSVRRPGLEPFAYLGASIVRGIFEINDRCFAVSGTSFVEVLVDGTTIHSNTVANDDQPVSFASNGSAGDQVMLVSAGLGYIYDLVANTLALITDGDFPANARCCEFMDGYFLVLEGAGSRRIQWSDLEDGTSWPSLSFIELSEAADNISSIIRNHREIWSLGFRTSQVLYDQGDVNNVFVPLQGVFIEQGCQGIFTPQRIDNSIMWMSLGENGQGMVFRANGYVPQRVSTHAVEVYLQRASVPTDARACAFQINGHIFYCLTLPRETTSWVYDVTTERWFEWAHWNPTDCVWVPFLANCHVFVFNEHLVGSLYDGTIYRMSQDILDDEITAF